MIANLIEKNKDFIAEEVICYTEKTYPSYHFDYELFRRDLHMVVDILMGELRVEGGVYSVDTKDDRDDSMFQLNRYKRSFTQLRNICNESISAIEKATELFQSVVQNKEIKDTYNNLYQQVFDSTVGLTDEQLEPLETIKSLIVANSASGAERNYHVDFIEEFFNNGFVVTQMPQNIQQKVWQHIHDVEWVYAKLSTTYKKVPAWYHENKKHYVDPTGFDRPEYERKLGDDIFTNAPQSLIDVSDELIRDKIFDPLKMYRPPNPITKYLHLWNGAENSPHHVDGIDGSDIIVFCYLTEEQEWKKEWGGYINLLKEVDSKILYSRTVLPTNGTMVIVNNASPIFKHGVRNLINRDVNRYTFVCHYTWTF